jgi:beta-ketodecanoyl-[acyl-carrier-protein] synthase
MSSIVIAGLGLVHPKEIITNAELISSYNKFVDEYNNTYKDAIAQGSVIAKEYSSAEFIAKASGILARYVLDKKHILDTGVMHPVLHARPKEQISLQAELCTAAAEEAIAQAGVSIADIDIVIVACATVERPFPAISIEVQNALAINGYAYDMNVACASAAFALQNAYQAIQCGKAKAVLICNPELCTPQLNFRDRDSHFIFGDAVTAMIVAKEDVVQSKLKLAIKHTDAVTKYSAAIYSSFGYLNRVYANPLTGEDILFYQDGRQVFKEVSILVSQFLHESLTAAGFDYNKLQHFFMHQANAPMNMLILKRLLGYVPDNAVAPLILDEFGNTSSAGVVIALYRNQDKLQHGEQLLFSSFGAGYSCGYAVLEKI